MKKRCLSSIVVLIIILVSLLLASCAVESADLKEDPPPVSENIASEEEPVSSAEPQPVDTQDTSADAQDTSKSNVQPAPTEPDAAPEGTILTIYGDGAASQTDWTLEQLQALEAGYLEIKYSTTRNWPTYSHITGHGVSLWYLLEHAGLLDSAKTLVFSAPDGYRVNITREQIFEVRFAFTEHNAEHSSEPFEVEPMIAWEWADRGDAAPEDIRPLFGQRGRQDVNTAASVKNLFRIEVITWDAGSWESPSASIPSGSTVSSGTELELTHPFMDNTCLYYTIDGSDPDYNSMLYNISTSYFQPDLIVPIIIDKDVTIKVFAGGLGKADSEIATFTYTIG